MTSPMKIAVLPGDGSGPEMVSAAVQVLGAVGSRFGLDYELTYAKVGGAAYDAYGEVLPQKTLNVTDECDAIFFGSVGRADLNHLGDKAPEAGSLLPLRARYGLFANLRPVTVFPGLEDGSPLKSDRVRGLSMLTVRELTGGLYFAEPKWENGEEAVDTNRYTREEIERIARVGFDAARKSRSKVTSVDKANVLACGRLWRRVVTEIHEKEYPDVELDHKFVDNMAQQMILAAKEIDVLLTSNMFGDILSDLSAVLPGSLGMLGSASLGSGTFGMYEPSGGTAPDLAGKGTVNPIGQIMSLAMMLRFSFGLVSAADAVENAVAQAIADGFRTNDIMPESYRYGFGDGESITTLEGQAFHVVGTIGMTQAIIDRLVVPPQEYSRGDAMNPYA